MSLQADGARSYAEGDVTGALNGQQGKLIDVSLEVGSIYDA